MFHSAQQPGFIKLVWTLFLLVSHFSKNFFNVNKQDVTPASRGAYAVSAAAEQVNASATINLPKQQNHIKCKQKVLFICIIYGIKNKSVKFEISHHPKNTLNILMSSGSRKCPIRYDLVEICLLFGPGASASFLF